MNRVKIVAKETFKNHIKSLSFWGMILLPIIFGIIGGLVGGSAGESMGSESTPMGIIADTDLSQYFEGENYRVIADSDKKKLIEDEEISSYAKVMNDNGQIKAGVSDSDLDPVKMIGLESTLNQIQKQINIEEAGLDQNQTDLLERKALIKSISELSGEAAGEAADEAKDDESSNKLIGTAVYMVLLFLMYIVLISFTNIVLAEVATEKGTKMIEFIFSSVKPGDYFAGKMIGNFLTVFVQILIYLVAIIGGFFFAKAKGLFEGLDLSMSASVLPLIIEIAFLFLLGIFLYLIIAGMLGSFASKAEDAGKIGMPLLFITVIFFILAMNLVTKGDVMLAKVLSYIPLASTFFMPLRLLNGYASLTEGLISIAILAITIFLAYKFGERVYKKNILNYSSDNWFTRRMKK